MRLDSLICHVKTDTGSSQQLMQQPPLGAADSMLHLTKRCCRLDSAIVECFALLLLTIALQAPQATYRHRCKVLFNTLKGLSKSLHLALATAPAACLDQFFLESSMRLASAAAL